MNTQSCLKQALISTVIGLISHFRLLGLIFYVCCLAFALGFYTDFGYHDDYVEAIIWIYIIDFFFFINLIFEIVRIFYQKHYEGDVDLGKFFNNFLRFFYYIFMVLYGFMIYLILSIYF